MNPFGILSLAPFLLFPFITASQTLPRQPAINVLDHGAQGDGHTLDTLSIQKAIDHCAKTGGGTVVFPPGKYLTGTLFLKDHVHLNVTTGATLFGSPNLDDYPAKMNGFPSRTDRYCSRALIRGEGLQDIGIWGQGILDGQGAQFRGNKASGEVFERMVKAYEDQDRYTPHEGYFDRPYLIQFVSCSQVLIEGVKLRNSAMWMQHYLDCDFVTIRGIDVYNHVGSNNDMIDIDCCRNVIVSDCVGDTDDDALTLKSTGARPTENVTITNCILRSHCNAIKAGTESAGGFRNITISNCVIQRSEAPGVIAGRREGLAGIALEIVDGGTLNQVTIQNIVMEGTTAPLFLRLGNRARPPKPSDPKPEIGTFRNVFISDILARGAGRTGCSITGLPGHPIENVSLSNIRISFAGGGTTKETQAQPEELEAKYPECTMFGVLPSYGFYCRHVRGLSIQDVRLELETPDERPPLVLENVTEADPMLR